MKRISMWSGPRNVSTAIMYSFAQRPDTQVVDEPLYGYYLKHTEAEHPGLSDLLNKLETNPATIVRKMTEDNYERDIVFYKNMAHHILDLDMNFVKCFSNIVLLRDPQYVLISLSKTLDKIELLDTGFEFQWKISEKLKLIGSDVIIIDSKDLLIDPNNYMQLLCERLQIPFFDSMLHWNKGGIPEDGLWAKYWYHNVHRSEGFKPYQDVDASLPENMKELYRKCNEFYMMLTENKLSLK